MYKQSNFHLAASTANDIFLKGVDALRALYYRLKELVLASDYIQIDESIIPVINNEKHRAVKAYLWKVRSPMEKCEVDPHQWLTDVLTKIPYYNQDYSKDLAELLTHNWKVSNS